MFAAWKVEIIYLRQGHGPKGTIQISASPLSFFTFFFFLSNRLSLMGVVEEVGPVNGHAGGAEG